MAISGLQMGWDGRFGSVSLAKTLLAGAQILEEVYGACEKMLMRPAKSLRALRSLWKKFLELAKDRALRRAAHLLCRRAFAHFRLGKLL